MIAFTFTFPAARYHATPWGRNVNEADVAWPPEPVRILRALIAIWWRKADRDHFPKALLDGLIDALAEEPPVFRLPESVHTHVRAFMPAPMDKKLIYDAFLRFGPDAELIAAWPSIDLSQEQRNLAGHLLERIGYLGRAESWTVGRISDGWDGEPNAIPRSTVRPRFEDVVPVDVVVPLTPPAWAEFRARSMADLNAMTKSKRAAIMATLPERLSDALSIDTSDWHKAGWSSPPPLRKIVYDRPPVGPLPPLRPRRICCHSGQPGKPEVARFVLAGRPQPRIEDSLKIGEIARWALMSGTGNPPREFSGRDPNGPQREDPAHAHAFFLPEDADDDGLIDHLVIYCRKGFSSQARRRLDRLSTLWLARGHAREEAERGRKEWRIALEDIAAPESFASVSALLRASRSWTSTTPYLRPWYAKHNFGLVEQIRREIERRLIFPPLADIDVPDQATLPNHAIGFHRIRLRRGLSQPDTLGTFLRLRFTEAFSGPLALGFGCHYGLGLFASLEDDNPPK
jgi:CRISPR-associated protein Csb2